MGRWAKWAWLGLALAALAAAGWRYWPRPEAPANRLATALLERRDLRIVVEAAGQFEPVRVVEVKSRASGEVLRVLAETGDTVPAGALLAEVDPRDVQNALDQAEADLASARVRARIAAAQAARMRSLLAQGVVAQQDVDTAEDSAASAEAAVLRAETNLELARERRRDVTLRAPIAGTVLERQVEPGQIIASATANVSGGTTLFRMADLSAMRVRSNIAETDVGRIRPGMPARLAVEAYPGRSFVGVVEKVEPQAVVEQNVTLFPVLVTLDNPERLLLPGMSAEVTLEVSRRDGVLAVPNGAVVGARDVASAAAAVGVDVERARAALRGGGAAQAPPSSAAPGGAAPDCLALREKAHAGGGPSTLSEAERTRLRECRETFGNGAARGRPGGGAAAAGSDGRRPGLLFLPSDAGPEPRRVTLGLSDWEYTEVVEGADEGESVLLITVAQIQRQQRAMQDRVRDRAGGMTGAPAPPARGR